MALRHVAALLLPALVCSAAHAQTAPPPAAPVATPAPLVPAPPAQIEPIPDPVKLPAVEVPYVHPLWKSFDVPAKLTDRPAPADFKTMTTLYTTVRVDEKGKVAAAEAVNPPLRALEPPVATYFPKWRFSPATRAGAPVTTWATYGIDLEVAVEKAAWVSFTLLPLAKDQRLEPIVRERPGTSWTEDRARFPHDISPKDPAAISIEDVDILPSPEKTKWDFSSVRVRSRVTALVEVAGTGAVRRIVPTGAIEPLVAAWMRQITAGWKLTPASAGGKPIDSWMTFDGTLEYTVDEAREKSQRMQKKNLRVAPPA